MNYSLLLLLFITACATFNSQKESIQNLHGSIQEINKSLKVECDSGKKIACSQYYKNKWLIDVPHAVDAEVSAKCNSGDKFSCYLVNYFSYFEGNIDSAKSNMLIECESNNAFACYFLAYTEDNHKGPSRDLTPSPFYEKGCKLGDARSCVAYFNLKSYIDKKVDLKKYSEIVNLIKKQDEPGDLKYFIASNLYRDHRKRYLLELNQFCKEGDKEACFYEALVQSEKSQLSEENINKYCQEGSTSACHHLCGVEINRDNRFPAEQICRQNCITNDYKPSCQTLGLYLHRKDEKKLAEQYLRNSCLGGFSESCHMVSYYLEKDNNSEEAKKFLRVLCDNGYVYGCLRLVGLEHKNESLSSFYAERACKLKNGRGCFAFATKLHKANKAEASVYFQQSCDLKFADGCLGMCLVSAEKSDIEKSKEYLIQGCNMSSSKNCQDYKNKKISDINLDLKDLRATCTYDPKLPWWYWVGVVGLGAMAGSIH